MPWLGGGATTLWVPGEGRVPQVTWVHVPNLERVRSRRVWGCGWAHRGEGRFGEASWIA